MYMLYKVCCVWSLAHAAWVCRNGKQCEAVGSGNCTVTDTIYYIYDIYGELRGGRGGNKKMPRKCQLMKSKRRDAAVEAS